MPKQYWLMKSEPDDVSFDDVLAAPGATTAWYGVRNYQARNFIRDGMQPGDGVLFYHSSCAVPGIAGIAEVASTPYAGHTQPGTVNSSTTTVSTSTRPTSNAARTTAPTAQIRGARDDTRPAGSRSTSVSAMAPT